MNMSSLLENAKFYSNLFMIFEMEKQMSELYTGAVSLMKILKSEGRGMDLFLNVTNMESNEIYMQELKNFLEFALSH